MDNIYRMSKLNNISEEENGYLKTILQIEDDEILHQYLGAISSNCFTPFNISNADLYIV